MSGGRGHYRDPGPLDCKVWVGNLGKHFEKDDLKAAFTKYGPLANVWVAQNPAGFAFVQFENRYDAEDAVHGMNKKRLCGQTLDVQFSTGESKNRARRGGGGRYGAPRRDISNETCFNCGRRGHFARACRQRRRSRSRSRSRSNRRSNSRSRSPRNRSPRRSSRDRSPRDRSPRERSPRERSPRERSPRDRSPQERSPRRSQSKSRSRSRSPRDNYND